MRTSTYLSATLSYAGGEVKAGLRLQILLLLGAMLLLAFIPLYFAISTYTEVALMRARADSNRGLAQAIAAHMLEAQHSRPDAELSALLNDQLRTPGIVSVGLFDHAGQALVTAGPRATLNAFARKLAPNEERFEQLTSSGQLLLAASMPSKTGAAVVLLEGSEPRSAVLKQLLAMYMALVALALLIATYFTVTHWIIRPLDALSRAARQVASTNRELSIPQTRSREFSELNETLKVMTARFLLEEQKLRRKVNEVELATEQLTQAQAQLVRSERMASVGQLAAGLAHEIGNPVAAMQGMQDLILTGDLEPRQQLDFIRRMRKETERVSGILRDLLSFARPTATHELFSPGNVEAAITETVTLLAPQPQLRAVALSMDIYPDLAPVTMSHEQLTQVLLNLIMNAADACNETQKGNGQITICAQNQQETVQLSVSDNGPGVAKHLLETIFEPFVSSKDVGKGTGLGLSVCRGLIESAGGSIHLDTERNVGCRFVIELPKAVSP